MLIHGSGAKYQRESFQKEETEASTGTSQGEFQITQNKEATMLQIRTRSHFSVQTPVQVPHIQLMTRQG